MGIPNSNPTLSAFLNKELDWFVFGPAVNLIMTKLMFKNKNIQKLSKAWPTSHTLAPFVGLHVNFYVSNIASLFIEALKLIQSFVNSVGPAT